MPPSPVMATRRHSPALLLPFLASSSKRLSISRASSRPTNRLFRVSGRSKTASGDGPGWLTTFVIAGRKSDGSVVFYHKSVGIGEGVGIHTEVCIGTKGRVPDEDIS